MMLMLRNEAMGKLIYLRDVTTLELKEEKCVGCGMCLVVCPHAVFGISNGRARIDEKDACMECGACAQNCPAQAIEVSAGVGCAAAVINAMLGREASSCCCVIESKDALGASKGCGDGKGGVSCC
jgi:NAD-dependent dihydropyrimidine dehydrogenase PreA subunit